MGVCGEHFEEIINGGRDYGLLGWGGRESCGKPRLRDGQNSLSNCLEAIDVGDSIWDLSSLQASLFQFPLFVFID